MAIKLSTTEVGAVTVTVSYNDIINNIQKPQPKLIMANQFQQIQPRSQNQYGMVTLSVL